MNFLDSEDLLGINLESPDASSRTYHVPVMTEEVCALLEISEANQRVLLHRGRIRLRALLATYLES